jgi:dihydroneopterin aldolase
MPADGHMTRSIRIRNISVPVRIGIHDFELAGPQRVIFNVTLELAESAGEQSDRIADALDYDRVRESVLDIAGSRHFNLQESLCREIVDELRTLPNVTRIVVASEKPEVYPDCDSVGYRIEYVANTG